MENNLFSWSKPWQNKCSFGKKEKGMLSKKTPYNVKA